MVKTKTEHISVLARCSSIIIITTLFFASPCHAITIQGIPEWLENAVLRSLNAIWSEIPHSPEIDGEGTLALVASRLFAGYDVHVHNESGRDEPAVIFSAHEKIISPDVKIMIPELREMALTWFENDISGLSGDIASVIETVPQGALIWADEALREKLRAMISERLPGWEFSQQIFISDSATRVNISFRPGTDMILAVKPSLYSRTIPIMFMADLEARLLPAFSPLIGVPVKWAEIHNDDIEKFAYSFLEDRNTVENMRADVKVKFVPGTVARLEAQADSENFMFAMWVAAYAGIEDRYPEIGASFAIRLPAKLNPEIYTEIIASLNDLSVIYRLGGRLELVSHFWAGVEIQWPESEYFIRLQYNPIRIHRAYLWWRYSPELQAHEAALGWRIDEHVSIEIYYDNTDTFKDDKIGLRGMWHL